MVRCIPDYTSKALCLISTILRLLINVKVGGVGASLPDKLLRVSCVSCAGLQKYLTAALFLDRLHS